MSGLDIKTNGRHQVWLTVYCNKAGLLETLTNNEICTAEQFEEFCLGFNQAHPLFSLIDAGGGKEAADAKIKGDSNRSYIRALVLILTVQNVFAYSLDFLRPLASSSEVRHSILHLRSH